MPDTIHDHAISFPKVRDNRRRATDILAQSWSIVSITFEILRQAANFLDDSLRNIRLQRIEVLDRFGFELDLGFHNRRLRSSFCRSHGRRLLHFQLQMQIAELFWLSDTGC